MKKGDVLEVLERHKMLTLALEGKITQAQAARELRLSLSHTKKVAKRLKKAGGGYESLFYQRIHPAQTSYHIRYAISLWRGPNILVPIAAGPPDALRWKPSRRWPDGYLFRSLA